MAISSCRAAPRDSSSRATSSHATSIRTAVSPRYSVGRTGQQKQWVIGTSNAVRGSFEGSWRDLIDPGKLRRCHAQQTALAMVRLAGSGLLAKSFWEILPTGPGFETQGILT
jgi:hypothetical protein